MKHIISSLLVIFIITKITAQTTFQSHPVQIKWAPLRLFDPVNSGLELSIEKNHRKTSTQLIAAYLMPVQFDGYDNLKGFRLGVEEKYFTKTNNRFRNYISAEFIVSKLKLDDVSYFNDTINGIRIEDAYQIQKNLVLLQFKIGKQYVWKRFVFDFSIGAGAKYIRTKHIDRIYPRNLLKDFNLIFSSKSEANRITLNIPATIRIGFLL